MMTSTQHVVPGSARPRSGKPSRARKQFNALVGQLDKIRVRLIAWEEADLLGLSHIRNDGVPLENAYAERQKQFLLLLERMYKQAELDQIEREKLFHFVALTAFDWLEAGTDDPEIKLLYNRHTGGDFDAEQAAQEQLFQETMDDVFGGDIDEEIELPQPTGMELEPGKAAASPMKELFSDIFRILHSQLDPDLEPDPAERQRKTALMQRATEACADDNLLALLELQFEVGQLDQDGLDTMDEQQLIDLNHILDAQLRELQRECSYYEYRTKLVASLSRHRAVTPQTLVQAVDHELEELRRKLAQIELELQELSDVGKLKAWLALRRLVPQLPDLWD
jgi:hypothetical protein